MDWIETPDSTALEGFGYDAARRNLEVRFKHGKTYVYLNVPPATFEQMQAAESKGQFVTENVKGVFEFQDKRDLVRPPRVRVRSVRR
jgi:hypothetical protein